MNYQRSNLELVLYSEKAHIVHNNSKVGEDNLRGVITNYLARVKVAGKIRVIGVYTPEYEAAVAFNEDLKKIYGDFAVFNSIAINNKT